jgi:hypothetical protein
MVELIMERLAEFNEVVYIVLNQILHGIFLHALPVTAFPEQKGSSEAKL